MKFFASCSRGIEPVLKAEIASLGADEVAEANGGVSFVADDETAMRICLWSRTASRILQPLHSFEPGDADAIYAAAATLDWPALFALKRTFAVDVSGSHAAVNHSHHAGLRLKDAIADRFRADTGERPNVDRRQPQVRVQLHLGRQAFTIGLDWAGEALHKRGYRGRTGEAPLKESLAAALLLRADWPARAAAGEPLLDPMCGSGTLAIEAAMMAADRAPGLNRRFAFEFLPGFEQRRWQALQTDAQRRLREPGSVMIRASDIDSPVLRAARQNAQAAGVDGWIEFEVMDFSRTRPGAPAGLLVCNPPYGERLGNAVDLVKLYSLFGAHLREHFGGWRSAILSPRPDLTTRLGLRSQRQTRLYNGPIECTLLECPIPTESPADRAEDLLNRLDKNDKRLRKWRRREAVENYRLYDADLPEYAIAVDRYLCEDGEHLFVQEYAPPKTVDAVRAEKRLRAALGSLRERHGIDSTRLHFRQRDRQRGQAQYNRHASSGQAHRVEENGLRFEINLDDYLDTGLFLDHRPIRRRLRNSLHGKRFLNLFCYTCAVSVAAAAAGAVQTVSVDLSNTYLDWAGRNLAANGFDARAARHMPLPARGHVLHRADCLEWLERAAADPGLRFDCIFLDPPSFSNSKRMEDSFDVQRDHVALVRGAAALLRPGGELLFSTNRRRFKLDPTLAETLVIRDITRETLDPDFARPRPPHRCWSLRLADR